MWKSWNGKNFVHHCDHVSRSNHKVPGIHDGQTHMAQMSCHLRYLAHSFIACPVLHDHPGILGILEFWKDKRQSASLMRPSCLFQGLLFNVSKPFSLGSGSLVTTEDLMVDCFVSSFRINYRNNQHFDMCLQPSSPFIYQLAYVKGTYSIVKQV